MNERLNLQDLIDFLAKKQDITKKDAEFFLRELIIVISETIENNESVKIKDFGVFKLVKVNARKSVDVNTGEAIEIAAHYKLSFTPDKTLKELINKPFAHFESVILEEGVSFDNIESETLTEMDEDNEAIIDESASEEVLPSEELDEEIPEEESIVSVDSAAEPEVKTELESELLSEPLSKIEELEESIDEKTDTEYIEEDNNLISDATTDDIESIFESHKRKTKRRRFISLAFIVLLIVGGFAVGGYYFQELAMFLTGDPKTKKKGNITLKVDEMLSTDTLVLEVNKKDSIVNTGVLTEDTDKNVSANNNTPLATIRIESGHTLRNISLKYYGNKSFWVYIYEENKDVIKNPNNVPIGTKLIIPAPTKYGIDAKDTLSVKKAKNAESILISKMSL
ncbi:HU family DNA-binding protein [Dysgonomonas sp. Marseille-P4677]|uniref:HU family DNA-binding protein n=1 Tax=Dysgonomonas sp. Marseille-P4677 TaxID=2364790 RepID=UPI0019129F67|nr:HU family DNA-binding protein [Dysgonomonas sp. Marseille-P4677]MBK5720415.1 HU family DNA-binding protein [Dysgonomonas sp. Marseille-P4677]